MTKRPEPIDSFQKALEALAALITALTTAAWTGRHRLVVMARGIWLQSYYGGHN